jgi:NAD(P)-dependent dehydrogenase (short-subunit alcohol dehydrogenase family)
MHMDFRGKTLIITGASMGIGRALALELAGLGVNLVLNARHTPALKDVATAGAALGVEVRSVAGDAATSKTATELVNQAQVQGGFYGFIHAAGVLNPGPLLWEITPQKLQEVLDSHVTAAHQLIRAAIPELLKQGEGLAVFFGSGAADALVPGIGAYCVAKAAEEHLARQLAAEAPMITSFIFRPGATETRMQRQARESTGGGAETLHRRFGGYKDRGELSTPEAEARALVRILINHPRRFQGKIVDYQVAGTIGKN